MAVVITATAPSQTQTLRLGRPVRRVAVVCVCLTGVILACWLAGLMLGTPHLSPRELTQVFAGEGERLARIVVLEIRLPRLVLGLVFGAALGVGGVLLQDAMRNPLAGPELLGVSAGAALVMAWIVVFQVPVGFMLHPVLALAGGLAAGVLVVFVARRIADPIRLILVGAALTAMLNALIAATIVLGAQLQANLLFVYLLGSMANHTWLDVRIALPWIVPGLLLSYLAARPLNLLQLGDSVAAGLGLAVLRTRLLIMLLAVGLVAPVVAVAGPVGWVSLLSPHIARRLLATSDAQMVLPVAALVGAAMLLPADLLARLVFMPLEVPVGAWTTLSGGPLLLVLLARTRTRALS